MILAQRLVVFILFALFLSCASTYVKPRSLSSDLASELPKNMREQFDIKEEGSKGGVSLIDATANGSSKKARAKKLRAQKNKGSQNNLARGSASASPSFSFPNRRSGVDPIWVGEKLTYTITYLGIAAGEVELEVLPFKMINGRKVFHFFGHATSASLFSLVYRLNDTVESFMDYEGDFSHRFHLVLDEKKQQRDSIELYDSEKRQTFYWSRWEYPDHSKREVKETKDAPPFSQDSLSALFYLRTVPLEPDSVVSFPMVSEGKSSEIICTVLRREKIRSPLGDGTAIVVRPETKYEGVLKKNGDSFIWYTDDARRFPVRMEARVRLGTVAAELRKIEPGSGPAR